MRKLQKHTIFYMMNKFTTLFLQNTFAGALSLLAINSAQADDLYTLFNKAKLYSPHLPLAYTQSEIAKQKTNQALASKDPKINFTAQEKKGFNKQPAHEETDYRSRNYAVQFSIPVYNKSQDEAIKTNRIGEKIASEQLQANYNELLQNIVEQYFKILNLNSKLNL
ncbi:TolC family protein, partial [Acinetobacter seifertii]